MVHVWTTYSAYAKVAHIVEYTNGAAVMYLGFIVNHGQLHWVKLPLYLFWNLKIKICRDYGLKLLLYLNWNKFVTIRTSFKAQAVRFHVHWMFRFTAFTSLFTTDKINKSSKFLNTDWFEFWEPDNVAEMFWPEPKPVLRVSSSIHVTF